MNLTSAKRRIPRQLSADEESSLAELETILGQSVRQEGRASLEMAKALSSVRPKIAIPADLGRLNGANL